MNIFKKIFNFLFIPVKIPRINIIKLDYNSLNNIKSTITSADTVTIKEKRVIYTKHITKKEVIYKYPECNFVYFDEHENYEQLLNIFWTKYIIFQKNTHH